MTKTLTPPRRNGPLWTPRTTEGGELEESKEWRWGMCESYLQHSGLSPNADAIIGIATFLITVLSMFKFLGAISDSPLCPFAGPLGWERVDWRRSKIRESQKCKGEDAGAGVCADAHTGSEQWHAQTLRTPQVVFTHQGTGPAGMRFGCRWPSVIVVFSSFLWFGKSNMKNTYYLITDVGH